MRWAARLSALRLELFTRPHEQLLIGRTELPD
jgi:hypothetical protein